jgi:hypothetical protein
MLRSMLPVLRVFRRWSGQARHDDSPKGSQGDDWVDSCLPGVTASRRIVSQDLKQKQSSWQVFWQIQRDW